VAEHIVFQDRPDLGHTRDDTREDRTRCGKALTPGTWSIDERPHFGCTACLPRPKQQATIDFADDEGNLW
jgi:hypothetical protein